MMIPQENMTYNWKRILNYLFRVNYKVEKRLVKNLDIFAKAPAWNHNIKLVYQSIKKWE